MLHTLANTIESIFDRAILLTWKLLVRAWRLLVVVWDWTLARLLSWLAIFLIVLRSFFLRLRMSHDNGIAARGRIRLVDDARYPENDFFRPGLEFDCRCRFGMVSFWDDARFVARGAALKFADTRYPSPLDLLMNTGRTTPFWNIRTFLQFMWLTIRGRSQHAIWYMKSDPILYVGCLDPLKRNPESFAQLYYHSKIPFTFTAKDGKPRYIKFRMIPWDRGPETGEPGADDLLDWAWCWQGIRPGETRTRNYLKEELKQRLARGPMRFHIELQLHEVREGESRDFLNSSIEWDERTHPWLPLAEVELTEALDHVESNETLITIRNRPKCMGTVPTRSIDDPAGMNYLRELAIWPRRARLLGNRIFGVPKPFPDERTGKDIHYTPFREPESFGPRKPLLLPQAESAAMRAQRREDLKLLAEQYPLCVPGDLPTYVEELPARERFDDAAQECMFEDVAGTLADLGLAELERVLRLHGAQEGRLAFYDTFYPLRHIPAVHRRWRHDGEFARQRIAGVNPTLIRLCRELPKGFEVEDGLLSGLLPRGRTLAKQMEAGRVYITDYAMLEGLKTQDACYLAAPYCLFHLEEDGSLLPLAIQLERRKGAPVFTPNDPPWLWLAVKTYAQSADAAHHEVAAHLLRTHLVMETVYVCARRNLHERHPVMELLAPHFRCTMAINHAARTQLLVPGGPLPQTMAAGYDGSVELLKRSFTEWGFERYSLRRDLEERGMAERDADGKFLLPSYYYRDDALAILEAIELWVGEVVGRFYRSDDEVREDPELQAWIGELADPERGNLRGLPHKGKLKSRQALSELLSQVIFNASAEHSAVNNGQYDYFGYVPNVPGAMHAPPPADKRELSEEWLVRAMPGAERSSIQLAMVHMLSEPTQTPLGDYPAGFFAGHAEVQYALRRFSARVTRISAAIRTRNVALEVPYPYLDPRKVGNSISI